MVLLRLLLGVLVCCFGCGVWLAVFDSCGVGIIHVCWWLSVLRLLFRYLVEFWVLVCLGFAWWLRWFADWLRCLGGLRAILVLVMSAV